MREMILHAAQLVSMALYILWIKAYTVMQQLAFTVFEIVILT